MMSEAEGNGSQMQAHESEINLTLPKVSQDVVVGPGRKVEMGIGVQNPLARARVGTEEFVDPIAVGAAFYCRITEVRHTEFVCEFVVRLQWDEATVENSGETGAGPQDVVPRQAASGEQAKDVDGADLVWRPSLEFFETTKTPELQDEKFASSGTQRFAQIGYLLCLSHAFLLQHFPFDRQIFVVYCCIGPVIFRGIKVKEYDETHAPYRMIGWNRGNHLFAELQLGNNIWHLAHVKGGPYRDRYCRLDIAVERNAAYYLSSIGVYIFGMVLAQFTTMALPSDDLEDRMQIDFLTLIVIFTLRSMVQDYTSASSVLTLLDKYIIAGFVFSVCMLIGHIMVSPMVLGDFSEQFVGDLDHGIQIVLLVAWLFCHGVAVLLHKRDSLRQSWEAVQQMQIPTQKVSRPTFDLKKFK